MSYRRTIDARTPFPFCKRCPHFQPLHFAGLDQWEPWSEYRCAHEELCRWATTAHAALMLERRQRPPDAMGDDGGSGSADDWYRKEFIERYDDGKKND